MQSLSLITFFLLFSLCCFGQNEAVLDSAEIMPMFPGCEEMLDLKERQECSTKNMLMFIYRNLKYPSQARENGIEGIVVAQFIIDKDGRISEINIVRDPGGNLGNAVIDVMNLMKDEKVWSPGIQDGVSVRVKYTLPVKFKLESNKKRKKKKKKN